MTLALVRPSTGINAAAPVELRARIVTRATQSLVDATVRADDPGETDSRTITVCRALRVAWSFGKADVHRTWRTRNKITGT